MRLRRRYWFVPTLAILGMLLALVLWWRGKEAPAPIPHEKPAVLPGASSVSTSSEVSWPMPVIANSPRD